MTPEERYKHAKRMADSYYGIMESARSLYRIGAMSDIAFVETRQRYQKILDEFNNAFNALPLIPDFPKDT